MATTRGDRSGPRGRPPEEAIDTAQTSRDERQGPAAGFWTNVRLFNGNTLLTQTGLGIFGLIFNLYLATLGLREDYIGLFWFANTAALGASAVPAGYVSNKLGPRRCLVASSALMGVCMAGVSLTTAPTAMVVGGALLGVGTALLFVPGGPFIMDNCDESERLRAFSTNAAVVSVAAVLGSLASGYLPSLLALLGLTGSASRTDAYRVALVVASATCALGAVPMLFARSARVRRTAGASAAPRVEPLGEVAARRALLPIAASVVITGTATGLVLPFYNVYLTEHLGVSLQQVGVIYAAGSLLMVPCSLAGPLLARYLGTVGTVAVPRALTAPFLLLPVVLGSPGAAALAYVARAGLMNATFPTDNTLTMELMPPRMRAVQAGVRSASWNVSWSIASLVAGQAIVAFGYPAVFVGSAVLHLASAAFYFSAIGRLRARRPSPRPEAVRTAG